MIRTIPVTEELCTYVEKLMYECNSRLNLCAFMIDRGMGGTEHFEKYHDDYLVKSAEYEVAKQELAKMAGEGKTWHMDFDKKELVVEADD